MATLGTFSASRSEIPAQPWEKSYDLPASHFQEFLHNDSWIAHVNNEPATRMCWGPKITKDLIRPLLIRSERVKENTPKHEIYTPACAFPTLYRHLSIDLTKPLQKSCWSNKPIPSFMKGNISATQVAFFGNMSTEPELEVCAEPADGFHKAPCSCTNKTKPTSLPRVTSPRRNLQVWDFHKPKLITFSIHTDS